MKLSNTARKFDNLLVADAYNNLTTFKAQLLESTPTLRDALTNERRMMSFDPSISLPTRKTVHIQFDNSTWLCGKQTIDYFKGRAIRKEVLLTQADGVAIFKNAEQALSGQTGLYTFAARAWIKTISEVEENSTTPNRYDIYFTTEEDIAPGTYIQVANTWHIVRSVHITPSEYQVAVSEELPRNLVTSVTFPHKIYDPTLDAWVDASGTLGTVPNVNGVISAIVLRWQTHYFYMQEAASKFGIGDVVLVVRKLDVTNPKVGDKLQIDKLSVGFGLRTTDVPFRVVNIFDEGATWALHISYD